MKPSMIVSLMVKMRHVILVLAILIGIFSVAFGQMYKWVDEKGTVHFTDDLSKIPEKYRTGVESRKTPKETSPPPPLPEAEPMSPVQSKAPEPEKSEVNLTRKYGVWLAEVSLNERVKRQFVVDTGASFTLISRQTAVDLGIGIDENTLFTPIATASGFIFSPLVTLKSLRVGKAVIEDVEALVHTMPSDQDGLLGNSFFNKFRVVLDPANGTMTLFSLKGNPSPDRPGGYGRDYWVGQFRFYRDILAELGRIKKEYESSRRSSALDRINKVIRFFEGQLRELERKARFAGVPRNWRR
jgi:clan AA aspartic protease (TIGR02281 family)